MFTRTYIHARTHAHTHACTHILARASAHTHTDRPTERVRRIARAGRNGAYGGKRRDSRGVPRADVRVEGRRRDERLRVDGARSTAA